MLVEFSIIPIGKGNSIGDEIAKAIKIVDSSGLAYRVNPRKRKPNRIEEKIKSIEKRLGKSLRR